MVDPAVLTLPVTLRHRLISAALVLLASVLAVAMTQQLAGEPLLVAGLVYAACFGLFAWRHPVGALAFVVASAAFQKDLSEGGVGAKFSIAEVNLALVAGVYLARDLPAGRWPKLGFWLLPLVLYLAVCTFSSVGDWDRDTTVSMLQMVLYLGVTVAVFANFAPRGETFLLPLRATVGVGLLLAILGAASGSGFVLGMHKNGVGAFTAAALVVAVELWLSARTKYDRNLTAAAVAIMAVGLIVTLSRGAWLASGIGVLTLLAFRGRWSTMFRLGMLMVPVVGICWLLLPDKSRDYATGFNPERENIRLRLESIQFAWDRFAESPVYGVGVGLRKEYDATNVYLQTLAETGALGLGTFLALHGIFFTAAWKSRKRFAGTRLASLPALGVALVAGRLLHGAVDHFWSRGAIMVAYAAVGMGLSVLLRPPKLAAGPVAAERRKVRSMLVRRGHKVDVPTFVSFGGPVEGAGAA